MRGQNDGAHAQLLDDGRRERRAQGVRARRASARAAEGQRRQEGGERRQEVGKEPSCRRRRRRAEEVVDVPGALGACHV